MLIWLDVATLPLPNAFSSTGGITLTASFIAQSWSGRAETGYKMAWTPFNLTPYAALQAQSFKTPFYNESSSSGSAEFALAFASHTGSVTRAEFGSWANKEFLLASTARLNVFGRQIGNPLRRRTQRSWASPRLRALRSAVLNPQPISGW
jgi:Autotransporter beta-domain